MHRFDGGLRLEHHKQMSLGDGLRTLPNPDTLHVPLDSPNAGAAELLVREGDEVAAGQCLAAGDVPVHAPCAGVVGGVELRQVGDPLLRPVRCLTLAVTGEEPAVTLAPIPAWAEAAPERLRRRAADAGLLGLGGAGFPTAQKLSPVEVLIVNGAECEPYIACDEALMRHQPERVIAGARIAGRAVGAGRVIIAVEDHLGVSASVLREHGEDLEIVEVPTRYPTGGERQLTQLLLGREVPLGGLPQDIGALCLNVVTVAALADAVERGQPLTHRIVTVTGPGVADPGNYLVPIGTPAHRLIEAAGGYRGEVDRLVLGGSMMGHALPHDDTPITKTSNCLLALTREVVHSDAPQLPCIRCMACVPVCPARLLPQQLYWHTRAKDYPAVEEHHLFACIECGACAQVCPSHIPLVDYFRHAKTEIVAQGIERRAADHARRRFEARQSRLAEQAAARAERLKRKGKSDKASAIAAAIERAKKRKS